MLRAVELMCGTVCTISCQAFTSANAISAQVLLFKRSSEEFEYPKSLSAA